jgi:NAD(P)-dependent dehydrogenase (short-subunit alcohol dehydrogenase family)
MGLAACGRPIIKFILIRMEDFSAKTMLITGASSGLGRAIALAAAARGARLALCGRSEEKLASLLAELDLPDSRVFAQAFDATDEDAVAGFVQASAVRLGSLDVLVNCAGANSARGPAAEIDETDLESMMRLNCYAPLFFMKAAYPTMAARGRGLVINILSTCCLFSNEGTGAYTASKSALDGLTKVFRKEARKAGVRVSAVYPGGINTPFRAKARPDYLDPVHAADAILALAAMDESVMPDELVLRPLVEANFS